MTYSIDKKYPRLSDTPRGRATAFERRADAVLADMATTALFALVVAVFVRALS